jgi:hypothetical protein
LVAKFKVLASSDLCIKVATTEFTDPAVLQEPVSHQHPGAPDGRP